MTGIRGGCGEANEIAGELGGGIGTARRLEVIDGGGERVVELALVRRDEGLVWTQPPEANCC